jgi:hypothetical protein
MTNPHPMAMSEEDTELIHTDLAVNELEMPRTVSRYRSRYASA